MPTTAELQEWINDLKRDVPGEPNRQEMAYALERMMQVKMGMNTSNVNLLFVDQKEAMDSLIHEMEDRPGEFPSLDESVQVERIQALVEDLGLEAVWIKYFTNYGRYTAQGKRTLEDLLRAYPPGYNRQRMVYGEWCAAQGSKKKGRKD